MICPQCKAEYRDGFTTCADCDVPLADAGTLSSHALAPLPTPVEPGDPEEDPFCAFWTGEDPRLHAELCAILDEEHIPHRTLRRQDHLFNINTKSAFTLGIPFSCFERAENAVKDAYDSGDQPSHGQSSPPANPLQLAVSNDVASSASVVAKWLAAARTCREHLALGPGPSADRADTDKAFIQETAPHWEPDRWYSEDATIEVWSGSPPEMADLLFAALRENCIHVRREVVQSNASLFVLPRDKAQARQIVRQVLEGAAPE
jgi:hypothetical protein